jgi:hypothetical protein
MHPVGNHKKYNPLYIRKEKSARIQGTQKLHSRTPRIPVVIEHYQDDSRYDLRIFPDCHLRQANSSIGAFQKYMREIVGIPEEEHLFFFVGGVPGYGGVLVNSNETIGSLYNDLRDEDGHLYVIMTYGPNFGSSNPEVFFYSYK